MTTFEFLFVGAWGFYLLIAIAAIISSELVDEGATFFATVVAAITLVLLSVFGDLEPIKWIAEHPGELFLYVVGYFAIGTVWSVAKWYLWLLRQRRKIDEVIEKKGRNSYHYNSMSLTPPKVGDHKSKIIGWMSIWPASMAWTILNDPVRRVFEEIYARISNTLQRISDRVFRGLEKTDEKS